MFYRQFYSELGKLLFGLANVDGSISNKEREALKQLVKTELAPSEKHTDKFGTDAAYYTEMEFDILEDTMMDPEQAFDSFLFFIENHHSAIDDRMRQVTLKVAKKLADKYHRTSKKEKEFIKKLEAKLNLLPV